VERREVSRRRARGEFRLFGIRPDPEREVEEELAHYFHCAVEDLVRQGRSPEEARREAERRFGSVRRHRSAIVRLERGRWRMKRLTSSWDAWTTSLGAAARRVRRAPGLATAVALILGLGLGANALMFGVIDRVLLSPPRHIVDADDVRRIYSTRGIRSGEPETTSWLTYGDYADLLEVDGFASAGAWTQPEPITVGRGESAARIRAASATPSLFSMLGVRPVLGRFFADEEDAEGASLVAVISEDYWERRFGRDPEVIGRRLDSRAGSLEIVGVAPAGFTGVSLRPVDVWLPLQALAYASGNGGCVESRNCWWIHAAVRLAPAAQVAVAEAQVSALHVAARTEAIAEGGFDPDARLETAPLVAARGPLASDEVRVSRWLAGVALIVLLIACANVANLFLARGWRQRAELGVRISLGAGRARVVRDQLLDSALATSLGVVAALAVVRFGAGPLHRTLLPDIAFDGMTWTPRLVVFLAVAATVTAVAAGVLPALDAARTAGAGPVSAAGRRTTRRRSRTRSALSLAQAVFSVVLLVGAGLFVRSLDRAAGLDLGYDHDRVLYAQIEWEGELPGDERARLYRAAAERVAEVPGVEGTALAYTVPFFSAVSVGKPRVEGREDYPELTRGGPYANLVSAGYIETMGMRLLAGRTLQPEDDVPEAPPVALVSRAMADDLWPGQDPLGRCLWFQEDSPCTTVVGVVADHHRDTLVPGEAEHLYFVSFSHTDIQGPPQAMMVRTAGDPEELMASVRSASEGAGPSIRFASVRPLASLIAPQMRSWQLGATLFSVFGMLALLVAAVGLYSTLAFDIAQRRREMGVRAALGATRTRILTGVMASALGVGLAGLGTGLLVAWWGAPWVEPLLFQVSPRDPGVYLGVGLTLLGVCTAAGWLPALRATRVDPAEALRAE
jgi:predicted permease